jgi:hypothetical protein
MIGVWVVEQINYMLKNHPRGFLRAPVLILSEECYLDHGIELAQLSTLANAGVEDGRDEMEEGGLERVIGRESDVDSELATCVG